MKSRILPAAGLVFGSGAAALLYQTTWLREFRLIFGSSTAASAAVLGIFMGGLGLGSALLGRRAECQERPLRYYARLEFLIAGTAALTPVLIWCIRAAYVALGGTLAMGDTAGTIVRLLLAAVVLLAPTILMGGTLPAMARFAVNDGDTGRRGLALLYGMNTLGAVTGAALGTFFLFERFGNHLTLWLACLFNAGVAVVALGMARHETSRPPASRPVAAASSASSAPAAPIRLVLFAAAMAGFVFLLMELVWYRMLSPIMGGTTFTLGLILAVALFGIGAGGVVYSLAGGRRSPTLNGFALTCALEALFIAIPYAMGDRLAVAAMLLQPLGSLGFYGRIIGWVALSGIVVLPAAFIAGIQFPMLIGLLGKGREGIGAHTGAAYAWNTAGAIAGSLAGGFFLIPMLSAPGAWQLVVVLLSACAIAAALYAQRGFRHPLRTASPLLAAAAAVALLFATGPTAVWRHSQLGVGLVKKYDETPNQMRDFLNSQRRDILWEADGVETSIGISKSNSLAFIVNGKCDGNAKGDSGTQVMAGLLGALLHPQPQRAAVVGLGTGSTGGWLAAIPSMERVDVMEIEPAIVKFAAQCAPVNQDALKNPKLHLIIGDARELLLTSKEEYDLIVSEPSNPYRAGIASLFTREYYQAAQAKLRPGGYFVQWLQTYDVDARTVQIFYATFSSVFPHVETWQTQAGDLMLVGSIHPPQYDVAALRERITHEPFKSALNHVWRTNDLEGVFSRYVANEHFTRLLLRGKRVPLNTDDRAVLEFAFARDLTGSGNFELDTLRREAHLSVSDRPSLTNGELDWGAVGNQQAGMFIGFDQEGSAAGLGSPERRTLFAAFRSYANDDLAGALQHWTQLAREPQNLTELTMVADCLAEKGDPAAIPFIQELKETEPAAAEAMSARFLWRQERRQEAGVMLQAALIKFRKDPWPLNTLTRRTLKLACEVAGATESELVAHGIYQALQKPFAIYNADESRNEALLEIGVALDGGKYGEYTLAGIEATEPHIPWQLNFLQLRSTCYAELQHPKAGAARRDLVEFQKAEGERPDENPQVENAPNGFLASARD